MTDALEERLIGRAERALIVMAQTPTVLVPPGLTPDAVPVGFAESRLDLIRSADDPASIGVCGVSRWR